MVESKWEKMKKHNYLDFLPVDEVIILIVGLFVFVRLQNYEIFFIILVILWYWFKIRHYERKIIEKERDIYNVNSVRRKKEEGLPVNQIQHEKLVEIDRNPMLYDLKQLENKKRFLVDKFVVLNLILVVLIELLIKK